MEGFPAMITVVESSDDAVILGSEELTFTVTESNDGVPCAYIIHVPGGTDDSVLPQVVLSQANGEDVKPTIVEVTANALVHEGSQAAIGNSSPVILTTMEGIPCKTEVVVATTDEVCEGSSAQNVDDDDVIDDTPPPCVLKTESLTTLEESAPAVNEPEVAVSSKGDPNSISAIPCLSGEQTGSPVEDPHTKAANPKGSAPFKKQVRTYGKIANVIGISSTGSKRTKTEFPSVASPLVHSEVYVKEPERVSLSSLKLRKRRLIVDVLKQIPIGDFKKQLGNTKDIVLTKRDMAPPTKKAMKVLETRRVEKFFCTPGRALRQTQLYRMFYSRLVTAPESETNTKTMKLVPLNSDLRIPSEVCPVTIEASDDSEFSQLRDKLLLADHQYTFVHSDSEETKIKPKLKSYKSRKQKSKEVSVTSNLCQESNMNDLNVKEVTSHATDVSRLDDEQIAVKKEIVDEGPTLSYQVKEEIIDEGPTLPHQVKEEIIDEGPTLSDQDQVKEEIIDEGPTLSDQVKEEVIEYIVNEQDPESIISPSLNTCKEAPTTKDGEESQTGVSEDGTLS